jgi:DNA-binding NarL/FixJ family response regulator
VRAALELIEHARPDAVLVDPRLPDVAAGAALIHGIHRAWPATRVILTGWPDAQGESALVESENCYVSKDGSPDEFVSAIVNACR